MRSLSGNAQLTRMGGLGASRARQGFPHKRYRESMLRTRKEVKACYQQLSMSRKMYYVMWTHYSERIREAFPCACGACKVSATRV